jgi:hypothetical protein
MGDKPTDNLSWEVVQERTRRQLTSRCQKLLKFTLKRLEVGNQPTLAISVSFQTNADH